MPGAEITVPITGSVLTWITHVARHDESSFSRISTDLRNIFFENSERKRALCENARFYFISITWDLMEAPVHFSDGTL